MVRKKGSSGKSEGGAYDKNVLYKILKELRISFLKDEGQPHLNHYALNINPLLPGGLIFHGRFQILV